MSFVIKTITTFVVLLSLSLSVSAQTITLYKKGTTLKLKQNLHCMDDETALFVTKKLRLLPVQCELRLKEAKSLLEVDIKLLKDKLVLQDKKYSSIISEKDKSIGKIQLEAINEMDKIKSSLWWKVTLGVLGGIAVGAGTTFLIMKYVK